MRSEVLYRSAYSLLRIEMDAGDSLQAESGAARAPRRSQARGSFLPYMHTSSSGVGSRPLAGYGGGGSRPPANRYMRR